MSMLRPMRQYHACRGVSFRRIGNLPFTASAPPSRRPLAEDALSKLRPLSSTRVGRLQEELRMTGSGVRGTSARLPGVSHRYRFSQPPFTGVGERARRAESRHPADRRQTAQDDPTLPIPNAVTRTASGARAPKQRIGTRLGRWSKAGRPKIKPTVNHSRRARRYTSGRRCRTTQHARPRRRPTSRHAAVGSSASRGRGDRR